MRSGSSSDLWANSSEVRPHQRAAVDVLERGRHLLVDDPHHLLGRHAVGREGGDERARARADVDVELVDRAVDREQVERAQRSDLVHAAREAAAPEHERGARAPAGAPATFPSRPCSCPWRRGFCSLTTSPIHPRRYRLRSSVAPLHALASSSPCLRLYAGFFPPPRPPASPPTSRARCARPAPLRAPMWSTATSGRTVFHWREDTRAHPRLEHEAVHHLGRAGPLRQRGHARHRGARPRRARRDGVWRGDLYLRGGGDPTFGTRSFVRRNYGTGTRSRSLRALLEETGIERVSGRVYGDESRFDSLRGGPESGYGTSIWVGPLSALAFNRGLGNESGRSFQVNPPLFAAGQLDAALERRGVAVRLRPRAGATANGARRARRASTRRRWSA